MKKSIFYPIFATALLSLGVVACDDDELEEQAKSVDVTITVTLPESYEGLSLAGVAKDSVKVAAGDNIFYTDAEGKVSATLEEGLYQLVATATRSVVGFNEAGSNGEHLITLSKTVSAEFSEAKATASVALEATKSEFTPYGSLSATQEALHLSKRGDTLNLADIFSPVLAPGDSRSTTITYELTSPFKKRETGGSATGAWVELPYLYSVESNLLIAADTLFPAPFDLTNVTGKKREVEPAVLRASLYAGSDLLAQKSLPVLIDTIDVQLIGIAPLDDNPVTGEIFYRLLPGVETPTITVAAPYASNGLTLSPTSFRGYFSNLSSVSYGDVSRGDSVRNTLANSYVIEGTTLIMTYYIDAVAVNVNGTAIPGTGEPTTGDANNGHPISAQGTSTATLATFYVNRSRTGQTPVAGETGYIDFFPYGSDPSNFITYRLNVETVSVTGIAPLTDDLSQKAAVARRFRTGVKAAVNASFFANLKVSKGPDRIYVVNENNGDPLLVIPSTINQVNGNPTIELVTGTAAQRNAALSIDEGVTYIAAQFVQLTEAGKDLPAETTISFKLCPKSKFDAQGNPDASWTIDVTTKVYAE